MGKLSSPVLFTNIRCPRYSPQGYHLSIGMPPTRIACYKVPILTGIKQFTLLIALACIVIPPVGYLFSLNAVESYVAGRLQGELQGRYIGDVRRLMDGEIELKAAINANIEEFLRHRQLSRFGLHPRITVRTSQGEILYPAELELSSYQASGLDRMTVATENMALLNQGLKLSVSLNIGHRTIIANVLLVLWICAGSASFLTLHFYNTKHARAEAARQTEQIMELSDLRHQALDRLAQATENQQLLEDQVARLRQELSAVKESAHQTEDGLLEELVKLEERLSRNLESQQQQEQHIAALQEQIQKFDGQALREHKQKVKAAEMVEKRFAAIYKSLRIHNYAIDGFVELTDEMQIRAEELLQMLHTDPGKISIKRKVFGNKSTITVFEVLFGYKGRLYYRTSDQRIEVLAIGTKNSQQRDLAFLKRL